MGSSALPRGASWASVLPPLTLPMAKRSSPCCWQRLGRGDCSEGLPHRAGGGWGAARWVGGRCKRGPPVALAGPGHCLPGRMPHVSPCNSPGLRPTRSPGARCWELAAAAWDSPGVARRKQQCRRLPQWGRLQKQPSPLVKHHYCLPQPFLLVEGLLTATFLQTAFLQQPCFLNG